MKLTHFFGSSSSKLKAEGGGKGRSGKRTTRGSFGSSSSSDGSVTTPRTVLPPPSTSSSMAPSSAAGSGGGVASEKKPAVGVVGAVTLEELEVALRRVVSTEEELAELLAEAEAAGRLGLALEGDPQAADEGELRETFAVFDADGDGRISAEELREVLASLGDERCSVEDCRRMIGGVDTDGDGFVCFDEFTRMMMHAPSNQS